LFFCAISYTNMWPIRSFWETENKLKNVERTLLLVYPTGRLIARTKCTKIENILFLFSWIIGKSYCTFIYTVYLLINSCLYYVDYGIPFWLAGFKNKRGRWRWEWTETKVTKYMNYQNCRQWVTKHKVMFINLIITLTQILTASKH
jgi:hypothetical protein